MSLLPLIAGYAPGAPIGIGNGRTHRADEFLAAAYALAERVPATSRVLLLCDDRIGFALGLAATLLRSSTALLPSGRAPHALRRIVQLSEPACALVDNLGETQLVPEIVVDPIALHGRTDNVPAIAGDHVAAILHTSGTTGDPQPHAKTWSSLVHGARALRERVGFVPGSTIVGAVPPQHMWGLEATIMLALQAGGVVHAGTPLLPGDVAAALQSIDAPRWLVATPLHISSCVRAGVRLSQLRGALTAAAPLHAALAQRFEAATDAPLIEIYGSTETGVIGTRATARETAFVPLDGVRVESRSDGIDVRGGHLAHCISLRDRAVVHADGSFTLAGRDADLVKIGGRRASLSMLDRELQSIDGVVDAAFVVIDDAAAGQRLAAFAVAPATMPATILEALRERIDTVFMPRPLRLVAALPRDALGKLSQASVRQLLLAGSTSDAGSDARSHVREVTIAATHPALPGHFPGRPIVPAAWIMTLVASTCREAFGTTPVRLERARFRAPLPPLATLRIQLERRGEASIDFACTVDNLRIADGSFVMSEAGA